MKHLAAAAAALLVAGCAFVPRDYMRLDEARGVYRVAQSDPDVARFAPAELREAGILLERATSARNTLDDSAVVDHLAYLARQRAAISLELAQARAAGEAARTRPYVARR
jgi:hypothetical protein